MIEARGDREIVLRLVDGEDLLGGLLGLEVDGALILGGIGMVRNAVLGYWNGTAYEEHEIREPAELLSMQGNIARRDEERIVHCHVSVARREGTVAGGHLLAATVANTAEIVLGVPRGIVLERREEPNGVAGLYPRT